MSLPIGPTATLAESARADPAIRAWLDLMPGEVRRISAAWALELGAPYEPGGHTAWVAPARTSGGEEVVLKVGMAHPEADHEADALRLWDGDGAVRLLRYEADPRTLSFLLERCDPGTPLSAVPETEQDVVIGALLRRAWATPIAGTAFRPLADLCRIWADETEARLAEGGYPGDPGLVGAAVAVLRERPAPRRTPHDVLLCTDLHAGNVLAARRTPWLIVDPKPYAGDAAYDVVQHLLNCRERLAADPHDLTARLASLAGLDVADVRAWTFARAACELAWWPGLEPVVRALAP
jgi:streptomycin 6-kinase